MIVAMQGAAIKRFHASGAGNPNTTKTSPGRVRAMMMAIFIFSFELIGLVGF